jgi:hypothetical protein
MPGQPKSADEEMSMKRLRVTEVAVGLCVGLVAASALADGSPFVGRWHWNQAQSTTPPGEPAPTDVTAEIARADAAHVKWSLTVVAAPGAPTVETFDAPANGEFYPVSSDTTAAFRLSGNTLQANFKGLTGETDALTCNLASDGKKMTCSGVLNDAQGHTTNYVDVYDRM